MRRLLSLICAVGLLVALGVISFGASRTFTNNTGGPVTGIRVTFSDMVWITSYDEVVFSTQDPVGVVSEITFSGGQLPSLGQFQVTWGEAYATVLSFAWLAPSGSSSLPPPSACSLGQMPTAEGSQQTVSATGLSHSGFSLSYDVDLTNPGSHGLSVTLAICTKGIRSLSLSTSRYHPVATANSPEHIEFEAVPAQGFSVEETQRAHGDPHGEQEQEPVWRLAFQEGTTITVRYGRTFTYASEDGNNGVTAYLDSDLFLATGERYLILPEVQEGNVWGAVYADELQGIAVHYRLPDDWRMWTPWNPLGSATFDPCTYEGSGAASTNLTCLVMSTVVAGPPDSLTANCRVIGGTEVTLVFSRRMRNLEQRSEELFQAFELVQSVWGEAVDARYLGAFPTTTRPLYSGEWTNSQGISVNQAGPGVDLPLFLHQVYHRWNGWVFATQYDPGTGWAYKFYGEAWNCYYTDKILNQLHVFPERWHYCRQFYGEYLTMRTSADAPVASANEPGLTGAQWDFIAYSKGAVVAYMLDREIQLRTQARYSLDDIVKEIWAEYGRHEGSFSYDDVEAILLRLTGEDFTDFFDAYVFGTERLVVPELR